MEMEMKEGWSGDGEEGGMDWRWRRRRDGVKVEMNEGWIGGGVEAGMEWSWI